MKWKRKVRFDYIPEEGERWRAERSDLGMFLRKSHLLDEAADSVSERSPTPTKTFFKIAQSTAELGLGLCYGQSFFFFFNRQLWSELK